MYGAIMSDIVVSAPGKVILHGEHSVVYGKVAVASSLNLRCFLRASFQDRERVVLDLSDISIHRSWKLSALESELLPHLQFGTEADGLPSPPAETSLKTLCQFAGISNDSIDTRDLAVISFLYLYCSVCEKTRPLPSIHLRLISQLPVGAGLGSSAAFSVCLSAVLLQLSGQIHAPDSGNPESEERGDHSWRGGQGWSDEDLRLINRWAFLGEKIIHGQPSGIDNSVSTLGGAIRFQNKIITPVTKMPRLKILLINTKVPRSTKTLVANVRKRHDRFPEVMEPVLQAMDGVAERSLKVYGVLFDKQDCADAFSELEELIDMNQQLLNAIGVGHASLDKVLQMTTRHGLHAKLTGAGGGGCAYALLTPNTSADSVQVVCRELLQGGFDCWETSVGAPGVTCHPDPQNDASIPPTLFQQSPPSQ